MTLADTGSNKTGETSPTSRSGLITALLGMIAAAALAFYVFSGPSWEPTGDAFLDAACGLGNDTVELHLCDAPRALDTPGEAAPPLWFARITPVMTYPVTGGWRSAINEVLALSDSLNETGEPLAAAKARLYASLLAIGIGEMGGARGQLDDVEFLTRQNREGDSDAIGHMADLYRAHLEYRLGQSGDGRDSIRRFVSRSIDMAPYVQELAGREFATFIDLEVRSEIYDWAIEDYRLIRELYEAADDWRRFGIAWYLQAEAEAMFYDYRRASVTFTTAASVLGELGYGELQAESLLRHADLVREEVPSLAAGLERQAVEIYEGLGIDVRAAMTDPLTVRLYEPLQETE